MGDSFLSNNKSITKILIIPFVVVLFLLIVSFLYSFFQLNLVRQQDMLDGRIDNVPSVISKFITYQTEVLSVLVNQVASDKEIQKYLNAKDSEALYMYAKPFYSDIKTKHKITHFYFHSPDKRNILRMYNPDKKGDLIKRHVLAKAVETKREFSGLELGKFGTFTLRVVKPVSFNGDIIGYLEIGTEIEEIMDVVWKHFGIAMAVVISKDKVHRFDWKKGMNILGKIADWSRLRKYVLVYASGEDIALGVEKFLKGDDLPKERENSFSLDGKNMQICFLPFRDVRGIEVGKLVLGYDVTGRRHEIVKFMVFSIGIAFFVFFVIVLGFGMALKNIDCKLKDTEGELKKEAYKFHTAFVNAKDAIIWIDIDTEIILNVNNALVDLLETDKTFLIGQSYLLLHPERKREQYRRLFKEYLNGRKANAEIEIVTKNNDIKIVELSVSILEIEGKKVMQAVYRDITIIKKLSKQYKDSLVFLEKLINTIPTPIFYKDEKGFYKGCNDAFASLVGKSVEDIIGLNVFDLVPPELATQYLKSDHALIKVKGKQTYESKFLAADGSERKVVFYKKSLVDDDGNINGIVGVMHDITDVSAMEDEIFSSRVQLDIILNNINVGIVLLNKNMEIESFNNKFKEWFPFSKEGVGMKCYHALNNLHDSKECVDCPAARTFVTGERIQRKISKTVSGKKVLFLVTVCPVKNKNGDVVSVLELVEDIVCSQENSLGVNKKIAYEKGISACSKALYKMSPVAIQNTVNFLLEATGMSNVIIYENIEDGDVGMCMQQTHKGFTLFKDTSALNDKIVKIPYSEGFDRWYKELNAGKLIKGDIVEFPEEEKLFLSKRGILSLLAIPIMVKDKFYGFIEFNSVDASVKWDVVDIDVLKAVAQMIGVYLERKSDLQVLEDILCENETIYSDSMVGVISVENGVIKKVNDTVKEMFGYYKKDILGKTMRLLHVSQEKFDEFEEKTKDSLKTGKVFSADYPMLNKDSEIFWCHISGKTFKEKNKKQKTVLVLSDITERKKDKEIYQAVFSSSRDALFVFSHKKYSYLSVNREALNMFGYSSEEDFIKLDFFDLMPNEQEGYASSADNIDYFMKKCLFEGYAFFDWICKRKDGTLFPAEVYLSKIYINYDEIILFNIRKKDK